MRWQWWVHRWPKFEWNLEYCMSFVTFVTWWIMSIWQKSTYLYESTSSLSVLTNSDDSKVLLAAGSPKKNGYDWSLVLLSLSLLGWNWSDWDKSRDQSYRHSSSELPLRTKLLSFLKESSKDQIQFLKPSRRSYFGVSPMKHINDTSMTQPQFYYFYVNQCHLFFHFLEWTPRFGKLKGPNWNVIRSTLSNQVTKGIQYSKLQSNFGHLCTHQCHLINT